MVPGTNYLAFDTRKPLKKKPPDTDPPAVQMRIIHLRK